MFVEEARAIYIVFLPDLFDNLLQLVFLHHVGALGLSHFSRSRFVIVVEAAIWNLHLLLLLRVPISIFLLFLHGLCVHLVLLLLLLVVLHLLHVGVLLLALNDLVHEHGLVHALRGVKARGPLSIPLKLMLAAHWN